MGTDIFTIERFPSLDHFIYHVGREPICYDRPLKVVRDDEFPKLQKGRTWNNWKDYQEARKSSRLILEAINGVTPCFNDPSLEARLTYTLLQVVRMDQDSLAGERKIWKGIEQVDFFGAMLGFECNKKVSFDRYMGVYDWLPDFMQGSLEITDLTLHMPANYRKWADYLAVSVGVLEVNFLDGSYMLQWTKSQLIDLDTQKANLYFQVEQPRSLEGQGIFFLMTHPVQLDGDIGQVYYADRCVSLSIIGAI